MIAAERTGRLCYAMEMEPRYVDVARVPVGSLYGAGGESVVGGFTDCSTAVPTALKRSPAWSPACEMASPAAVTTAMAAPYSMMLWPSDRRPNGTRREVRRFSMISPPRSGAVPDSLQCLRSWRNETKLSSLNSLRKPLQLSASKGDRRSRPDRGPGRRVYSRRRRRPTSRAPGGKNPARNAARFL